MPLFPGIFFMEIIKYKEVPSKGILKKDIVSLIRLDSKSVFNLHDPIGLRYLVQLRLSLSDTPSGICDCNHGIEDTSHFIFACPFYATQRATLVTRVNEILPTANFNHLENQPKLCLYGDPSLSNSDNKKDLLSTIMYIKETRRFST